MKIKPYLVLRVGFEGIDKIIAFSLRAKKARKYFYLGINNAILADREREKKINNEFGWAELTKEQLGLRDEEITKRFCIQQWNGKKFDCECLKLGVKKKEEGVVFY